MTEIKQNGLVVAERELGENDKLLTILVERYGKLFVVAKGVRSLKNRHVPSCQLFCYASFGLRKKGNYYYITDSDLIENYYDIRNDILKLSLASYLCDVVCDVTQEGYNDDAILRLTLNMLYAISKDIRTPEVIRAVFELRIASELGFSPSLDGCNVCDTFPTDSYYLDIVDGIITCKKCQKELNFKIEDNPFAEKGLNKPVAIISKAVIDAINYIISAKQERILSFTLDQSEWTSFFDVAERFLLNHLERGFFSLDFYKSMLN